jgi:hypothetical protein
MPAGRPTKYKKQYCEEIIRFFDVPQTKIQKVTQITASGVTEFNKEVPENLPTIIGFARKIGVLSETLKEWADKYEEFSVSYRKALELEKEFLIQNGLKGFYQPNIFQFIASNLTDMKNKETKEHTGADGGPIQTKVTVEFVDAE